VRRPARVRVLTGIHAGHIFPVELVKVLLDPASDIGTPYWPDELEVIVGEDADPD
jgi:hypothetical protein